MITDYVIVSHNQDTGVARLTYPCAPMLNGESEQDYLTRIAEKDVNGEWVAIRKNSLPEDNYFRNAWVLTGGQVSVDMGKARNIHMNAIRKARDEALKLLDIETLKGNDVQAQKQILRDLPQTFDLSSATTPEELKALFPSILQR